MDPEIDALLRSGEIEQAASLARARGRPRRAAELLALAGRHAEGVMVALEAGEWRLAMDLAFASGDERIVVAVADEVGRHAEIAQAAAAQARIARRIDVAARVLEAAVPTDAAAAWYEIGEYARAGRCWDRVGDTAQAIRAYEQQVAQAPDDAPSAERLGELRASRGDLEGAARALQVAVRAGGGPIAMRKLVCALKRIGLEGSARAVIRRLRGVDPEASMEISDYDGALPVSAGAEKRYAGRYRVVREVGSGATGRVMEALDELTGETVALKVLSVGDDRTGAFGRFMREAELASVLDDPTLVRMRALDPEGPTIVYDWMPGGTLAERIGALSVNEVRGVSVRLLAALEALHRNGVVHRDLKPSNVLFDPAGQARLGDLGAAHLSDLGATVTGGLVGSLPYMAPEQITGAPVTAATDLYAFGCVLFQMLTGELPFPGPDYVTQHLSEAVPSVSDVRPGLGLAYDAPLAALLAKDPLQRPPDVAAARALLAGLPWSEPDDARASRKTPAARVSTSPPTSGEEGARLVPGATPGRWSDTKIGREVELVRLPRAAWEIASRWAAASATDLQPVYHLDEDGDELVAWVEPIGGRAQRVDELPARDRARVASSLARIGVPESTAATLPVFFNAYFGTVVPLAALQRLV